MGADLRTTLRPATIADLATLRAWDEEPHVLASDPNDDWGWETELLRTPAWREQLIAEVDGRAIGFVQIIDPALEDSHYWGDVEPLLRGLGVQGAPAGPLPPQRGTPELRAIDIWLGPPDAVGRGFGSGIMSQAIERCFAPPQVVAIVIDPLVTNTRSHRFYERFGFTPVGPRRFGQDDCLVYRLTKQRWLARAERHEEHIA